MANIYVTGPVHVYVGVERDLVADDDPYKADAHDYNSKVGDLIQDASSDEVYYLGTYETTPKIEIAARHKPVYADIGGDEVPFDYIYMGEDGFVTGVLNRWNESVYAACAAKPISYGTDPTMFDARRRGRSVAGDVGALMLADGKAYQMWLHYPYYDKEYGQSLGMPAGYHFFAAFMTGPEVVEGGTRAKRRLLQFKLARVFSPEDGCWDFYDDDMSIIPETPPTGTDGAI